VTARRLAVVGFALLALAGHSPVRSGIEDREVWRAGAQVQSDEAKPQRNGAEISADDEKTPPAAPGPAAEREPVIHWQPWSRRSFERAAALRRPVLLYLRAEDCRLCASVEKEVFGQPDVIAAVGEQTVAIAVDADLRPDLAGRYIIGLIPTAVYLIPNGEPMYNVEDAASLERLGGYFSNPLEFRDYLSQVVRYFRFRASDLQKKASDVAKLEARLRDYPAGDPPRARIGELIARMRDSIDFSYGGFGNRIKIINDAPFRLFRILSSTRDEPALAKALRLTTERILDSPIHDLVDGGFHQYATRRDWSVPAWGKRLEVNARAIRLLVAAAAMQPEREDLSAAVDRTAAFVLTTLARPDGGFAFSQLGFLGPDDAGGYFTAGAQERQTLRPPPLDTRRIAPSLAEAAAALLEAGALLGRSDLEESGLETVDYLTRHFYRRGRGLVHYLGSDGQGRRSGLLLDQVAGLETYLMAYQVRGDEEDLGRAEDLFRFCRANLRRDSGHFIDRVDDRAAVGKMRRPLVSPALNGRLALAAYRLAVLTGDPAYRSAGDATLGALAGAVDKMEARDAPYLEALLAAVNAPIRAVVVPGDDPQQQLSLRRAALLLPVAGAVTVTPKSPERSSGDQLTRPPADAVAGVYLCSPSACRGPFTPGQLLDSALFAGAARGLLDHETPPEEE
jgi:uncharacterized protein YyaL (SSP411 family)